MHCLDRSPCLRVSHTRNLIATCASEKFRRLFLLFRSGVERATMEKKRCMSVPESLGKRLLSLFHTLCSDVSSPGRACHFRFVGVAAFSSPCNRRVCIPVSSPLSPTPLRCGVPHFPRLPHCICTLLSPQKARIHRRDKGWLPLPLLSSPDGDARPLCGSPRRLGAKTPPII